MRDTAVSTSRASQSEAEAEWRKEHREQSRAIVDQQLGDMRYSNDAEREAINGDARVTLEDRARYNNAFDERHAQRLEAERVPRESSTTRRRSYRPRTTAGSCRGGRRSTGWRSITEKPADQSSRT